MLLFSKGSINSTIYSLSIFLTSLIGSELGSIFLSDRIDLISLEASTPTSALIKNSSILLRVLSSISFFIIISFNPDAIFDALFLKPNLNFSNILIKN